MMDTIFEMTGFVVSRQQDGGAEFRIVGQAMYHLNAEQAAALGRALREG